MKVSVVIRALNEEEHIGRLLTGLAHQTREPDEIIVVDSGSTDATLEIAGRFGAKILHIAPEEFSFGRSLNIGVDGATGDLVVIPSAHVYPLFDTWIEKLIAPFDDPKIALTYGRQVGDRITKYSEHRILAKWFPPQSQHRQDHPFCNNANAAIRKSLWEDIRYDEELTGLEDLDWARRAMDRGWGISYSAEAVIVHVHQESWDQIVNRYRREAIAHKRIFHDQRFTLLEMMRLIVMNVASDWYHALLDGVLVENLVEIPRFRFAQFWGTYKGFRHAGGVSQALKRRFYYPTHPSVRTGDLRAPGRPIDYGTSTEMHDVG